MFLRILKKHSIFGFELLGCLVTDGEQMKAPCRRTDGQGAGMRVSVAGDGQLMAGGTRFLL